MNYRAIWERYGPRRERILSTRASLNRKLAALNRVWTRMAWR